MQPALALEAMLVSAIRATDTDGPRRTAPEAIRARVRGRARTARVARRAVASSAALAAVATLSRSPGACPSFCAPEPRVSTPTGERSPPTSQPFYSQVLEWSRCGDGMQCATATAPLDWDDPAPATIELALVRQPATGDRLGSLLVNPGGPGGSGYDFVLDSSTTPTSEPLQQRFDIVGFDPRGVGRSSAVSCYDVRRHRRVTSTASSRASAAATSGSQEPRLRTRRSAQACLEETGDLLAVRRHR